MEHVTDFVAKNNITDEETLAQIPKVSEVYEQAVTACAQHIAQGRRVWLQYIAYHVRSNSADAAEQIKNLYRRALSLPYKDMEKTHAQFQEWASHVPGVSPSDFDAQYKKALAEWEARADWELKIDDAQDPLSPDYTQQDTWRNYLQWEKDAKSPPPRVKCLYERMVRVYCLNHVTWGEYVTWVRSVLASNKALVLEVHKRAVRNCPWSSALWCSYVQTLHRSRAAHEEVAEVFEAALVAGLQQARDYEHVYLAYIDYLTRQIDWTASEIAPEIVQPVRDVLQRASDYFETYFPEQLPLIQTYWAQFEAFKARDLQRSRDLWEAMLRRDSKNLLLWQQMITCELSHYHTTQSRDQFNKVHSQFKRVTALIGTAFASAELVVSETLNPTLAHVILQQWTHVTRLHGTSEDCDECQERIDAVIGAVSQQETQQRLALEQQQRTLRDVRAEVAAELQQRQLEKQQKKRKKREEDAAHTARPLKRQRVSVNAPASTVPQSGPHAGVVVAPSTIRVSGLHESLTLDQLRTTFAEYGEVLSVEYQGDKHSTTLVQYRDKSAVDAVMKRVEPIVIGGHTVLVQPAILTGAAPAPSTLVKRESRNEQLTIFLTSIAFKTSQETLETSIRESAANKGLLAVRLIFDRDTGKSRGFAYLDYDTKDNLEKAVTILNTLTIDGWRVKAAKSNPSKFSSPADTQPVKVSMAKPGLVPRALRAKK
jgi:RNA recognition motif-containing protein